MFGKTKLINSNFNLDNNYDNSVLEYNIVQYLNNKYNDDFEIVKFVKNSHPYYVEGNGFSFNDVYIDTKEYVEYIAKSKSNNVQFKVAFNDYLGTNYYDFYLVKYAEKIFNEKINNLKFNPHIELDMDLNPQYISDLEKEYYSENNLNLSFDDLDSISGRLKYNLVYDYSGEIGIDNESIFSEIISSMNDVKKAIGATCFGNYVTINTKNTDLLIKVNDYGNPYWDSYISVSDEKTQRLKNYYYTENGYTHSEEKNED